MSSRWLLLLPLLVAMPRASRAAVEPALVSVGDTWVYLPGTDEPPAQWRELAYDDSQWRRGPSGFGWTERGENTLLIDLPKGIATMYFRRPFVLNDPAEVAALTFRADWHGGFVLYLNGTEILRDRLGEPGSTLTRTNLATSLRVFGDASDLSLTNFASLLHSGTNMLAVELHQVNPQWGFGFVLVPELLANFTRGPYLQPTGSGTLDVVWRTPLTGPAKVEYGPTLALGLVAEAQAHPDYAFATMPQLQAGSLCYYRVTVQTEGGVVSSPSYRTRTLPAAGPLTALLFGDSGSGARSQFDVAGELTRQSSAADLFVHLGDIVYLYFTQGQTDTRCLSVYRDLMRTMPGFFCWGNHDLQFGVDPFRAAFRMPTNNTPPPDHLQDGTQPDFYYSFDAGDAHFAVLFWPYSSQYYMRPDCPQLRWLEADLAASSKRWKFLCLHHPVNTSGVHRWDDENDNGLHDRLEVQERLLPVARRHRVQAIFSGHDHNYERFQPVDGVHTVVSGGGGINLYGLRERDANSATFFPRWHLCRLELKEDTMRLTALDPQGQPLDVLEFRDTPPDSADSDGDGLGDLAEELAGSNPHRPDTDGDGLPDGWEFLRGLDPAKPSVMPSADGLIGAGDPAQLLQVLAAPIPRPPAELRIHTLPDGRIQLRWLGSVGSRVQVETAPSSDGPFEPAPLLPARSLAEDRQAAELPVDSVERYFRVRLVADGP